MDKKIFCKSVGISSLLLGFVATIILPILLTFSSPLYAATACDPNLDPTCAGGTTGGGAKDADWADGQHIFVNKTVSIFVKNPGTITNSGVTVTFTPASFATSNTSGTTMTLKSPTPTFSDDGGVQLPDNCPSILTVNNYQTATTATLKVASITQPIFGRAQCNGYQNPITLQLGNTFNAATTNGTNNTGSNGSNGQTPGQDCPINDGNSLQWVLCPIVLLGQATLTKLNALITNFLYTHTEEIFTPQFETAFNTFRNIGVGLLVIAGLVMVISQAAGLEIFAAYTVRKALPRIIIAAIGMALAWPLLELVVTFFNDLGTWANQLIMTAAQVPSAGSANNPGTAILAGFLGTGIFGTAIIFLGWAGLFSLLATGLLALLVGLFVLALRQLVILLCILTAPLAIAASVLPGTQKIWTFWRDALIAALIMFPIITGFIAAGTAMAFVAGAVGTNEMSLLAVIIYFAPYILLPFAFRLAGGLMATIFSLANDRSRGAFDRLRGFRQEKTAANWNSMKMGQRFSGTRYIPGSQGLAKAFNSTTLGATTGGLPFTRKRREALAHKRYLASQEYGESRGAKATQFDDSALQAMSYGNESAARENMARDFGTTQDEVERGIAAAKAAGGFGISRQAWAVRQMAATGTAYKNMEQMMGSVARASGGNMSLANSMIGEMRGTSERAGRGDLKPGFGTLSNLAQQVINNGGSTAGLEVAFDQAKVEAARGFDNATLLRSKPQAVSEMSNALVRELNRNVALSNDTTQPQTVRLEAEQNAGAIRAKIENMRSAGTFGYGPEVNMERIHNAVSGTPGNRQQADQYEVNIRRTDEGMTPREVVVVTPQGTAIPTMQPRQGGMRETYDSQAQSRRPMLDEQETRRPTAGEE